MKEFNDYDYTREAIIKEIGLMELHGKDGSAYEAGCQCINTKHTYNVEGLSQEMVNFAKSKAEQEYYIRLSQKMRKFRQEIDSEAWTHHTHLTACEKKVHRCIATGTSEEVCKRKINCG